jgi:HEPN domain-containing protein
VTENGRELDELRSWLEEDEARSRPYRAQRLQLLIEAYGSDDIRLFHGGPISFTAFHEARLAYLHGLFIACVLLCQTCLEHMLAGIFRLTGRNDLDRASFSDLLREAKNQQFLSDEEYALFDRLRDLRNPYAHPRAPAGRGSLLRRAIDTDTPVEDLMAGDAELAITALLRLCQRAPFALPSQEESDGPDDLQ